MENSKQVSAFCDDILAKMDAVEISKRIASGEIKASEAVEAAIARAKKVNPKLNAIVTDTFDEAMTNARNLRNNFFRGVPAFIKDNDDIKGVPTLQGSRAVASKPAKESSAFVKQFLSTGLIPLGKTSLPEFGLTATTEPLLSGPARNPWNTGFSTGGSSGGSAAMVAAGVVPIAHGNDGGGSIRIPAACCGLVGLKPSRDRLVNHEAAKFLPVNIVHQGVLTRTVRDTAYFFHAAEQYYKNPRLPEIGLVQHPGKKRLKIGFYTDCPYHKACDLEISQGVHSMAKTCEELGHTVREITSPITRQMGDDFIVYWGMLAFMIKWLSGPTFGKGFDRSKVEPLTTGLSRHFIKKSYRLPFMPFVMMRFAKLYNQILGDYDALLSPVLGHEQPEVGVMGPDVPFELALDRLEKFVPFTPAQNVLGTPAISLPTGHLTANGLPGAIQFAAATGQEKTLLELSYEIEEARPWPFVGEKVSGRVSR
ncbi:MAG: amidase [Desulfatibacillaceae bacterium]|nr:amidase [Desulfatibacillaceae bacterium]